MFSKEFSPEQEEALTTGLWGFPLPYPWWHLTQPSVHSGVVTRALLLGNEVFKTNKIF